MKKTCKHCHQQKDRAEFYKHSGFKDGLNSSCKSCEAARIKERTRARAAKRKVDPASQKVCSVCRAEKPISDFFKDRSKKLGVASTCKLCSVARANLWYQRNPERARQIQRHATSRRGRSRVSYYTFWLQETDYNVRACLSEYHGRRRQRSKQKLPGWADHSMILAFYKNCPPGFQVDHIIPLKGRYVSGLHVLENLQYLTKDENAKKGNRFLIHLP